METIVLVAKMVLLTFVLSAAAFNYGIFYELFVNSKSQKLHWVQWLQTEIAWWNWYRTCFR